MLGSLGISAVWDGLGTGQCIKGNWMGIEALWIGELGGGRGEMGI